MGKLVDIKKAREEREDATEDTKVDEQFDSIIQRNKKVRESLAKERAIKNEKTLNDYKIRRKT